MWVYILSSPSRRLYIGVTNDLCRRWHQHQQTGTNSYTDRHDIRRLVYFESGLDPMGAIAREKVLKRWLRRRKLELVESSNPDWRDFAEEWGWKPPSAPSLRSG